MLAAPADWDAITVNSKRPVPMLRAFLCSGASTLLNICGNFHKKRKVFSNLLCVVDKPYYIYVPLGGCKDAIMDALCKHCEMFMTPSTNSQILLRQPHVMVANDFVRVMEDAGIDRCSINKRSIWLECGMVGIIHGSSKGLSFEAKHPRKLIMS